MELFCVYSDKRTDKFYIKLFLKRPCRDFARFPLSRFARRKNNRTPKRLEIEPMSRPDFTVQSQITTEDRLKIWESSIGPNIL